MAPTAMLHSICECGDGEGLACQQGADETFWWMSTADTCLSTEEASTLLTVSQVVDATLIFLFPRNRSDCSRKLSKSFSGQVLVSSQRQTLLAARAVTWGQGWPHQHTGLGSCIGSHFFTLPMQSPGELVSSLPLRFSSGSGDTSLSQRLWYFSRRSPFL